MNFTDLKNFMDRLCAWRIPGNAVSVCINNKEVFSYSAGYADLENGIPMTGDKLINIYSCSKVATVVAALQLYEKGFFLLDNPLYDFIPEFKNVLVKDENGDMRAPVRPITLRHLFNMTSGITYNRTTKAFEKAREITYGRMDTLSVVKCLASDPLEFDPGDKWLYGLNHDILVAVIEVISGKKFRDYMKENIFDPLGMKNTFYHNEALRDRMAEQYHFEEEGSADVVTMQSRGSSNKDGGTIINVGKDNDFVFGPEYDSGGAGITTSVSDYSKFCSALANYGLGATGERILSRGTIDLLRSNQLSQELLTYFNWDHLRGYGYGLGVRTLIDRAKSGTTGNIGEFGWGGAAGANVFVDPEIGLSLFYAHHMLNPMETYYQPRLRNVMYNCINR